MEELDENSENFVEKLLEKYKSSFLLDEFKKNSKLFPVSLKKLCSVLFLHLEEKFGCKPSPSVILELCDKVYLVFKGIVRISVMAICFILWN